MKENLKCIADFVKSQLEKVNSQISRSSREEISPEEMCTFGSDFWNSVIPSLERDSYSRMQKIIEKECKASEFFVERIYRTAWNLTDQYISAIIEVAEIPPIYGVVEDATKHVALHLLRREGVLGGVRRAVPLPSLQGASASVL